MSPPRPPSAIAQYVEDELLRAPLVFDLLFDAVGEQLRQKQATLSQSYRVSNDDTLRVLTEHWARMAAKYMESLGEQTAGAVAAGAPGAAPAGAPRRPVVLELVDDDAIALDVEIARAIDAIKDAAEGELRDLQAYLASVVGDMDVAEDHNPLNPAVHGRALRAAATVLQNLQQQLHFIRLASAPFAQLLRQSFAASCTRLEEMGVEPAVHRAVVLPDGTRRVQVVPEVAYVPDLQRIRDAMPRTARRSASRERVSRLAHPGAPSATAPADLVPTRPAADIDIDGLHARAQAQEHRARGTADRQAVELVNRLFKAFALDERVPTDVGALIARLRGAAMRLTLRDPSVLDRREHPLWRLVHLFAYHAEMLPHLDDPERQRWLQFGQHTIDDLAAATMQKTAAYQAAVERMEECLQQRLERRCQALASQFEALQRTEAGLAALRSGRPQDEPVLDTVPAALMPRETRAGVPEAEARAAAEAWFDSLVPGQWLRLLLKGHWVHAQLLWRGDRRQIVLVGDGVTESTWAVRRGVLLTMHRHGLAKTLQMRSLVGAAAMRVQEQLAIADAA